MANSTKQDWFSARLARRPIGDRLFGSTLTLTLSRKTAGWCLSILLLVMIARVITTYPVLSGVWDEGLHIAAGMEAYQAGVYEADVQHPPLSRLVVALLPYLDGVRTLPGSPLGAQSHFVLEQSGDYWRTLTLGRLGNLIFLPLLLFYVYRWSADLYGRIAGLIAATLVSMSPNVLAHAGVATTDLSITATLIPAAYHLYRWFNTSLPRQAVLAGFFMGVAVISKYSAIGFLPLMIAAYLALLLWRRYRDGFSWKPANPRALLTQGILCCLCGLLPMLVCFHIADYNHRDFSRSNLVDAHLTPGSAANRVASTAVRRLKEVAPGFLDGIAHATVYAASGGHPQQFFLGEIRHRQGWRLYLPMALAVKTTLSLLLLTIMALACLAAERSKVFRYETLYVAAALASILLVGIVSNVNIGVRHILPMYPFLAVLASSLFALRGNTFVWKGAVLVTSCALVAGHAATSAAAHPDYLPFFNILARGREHLILADSNLDWGQDLGRLARYLEQHDIKEVNLSYFGMTSPAALGIKGAKRFGPADRPRGWVAISSSHLQGIDIEDHDGRGYRWLLAYTPYARVGKTIWLYYVDGPPPHPNAAASLRNLKLE